MSHKARRRASEQKSTRWFWMALVFATVKKSDIRRSRAIAEVWRNHHLFAGQSQEAALRKARRVGNLHAGDDRGSLTLFGSPARREFLGIEHVAELVDGLYDGCEIGWELRREAIGPLRERMAKIRRRRYPIATSRIGR